MIGAENILAAVRPRLRHLVAVHGDGAIELLKSVTGFQAETIGGWLALEVPPTQPLLKVWHLLDALGYDSPEVQQVDALQQYLGRLYTLGVVDMEKLKSDALLNVKNAQTVVQFLRGQPSMKLKADALDGLRRTYDEALNRAIAALPPGMNANALAGHDVALEIPSAGVVQVREIPEPVVASATAEDELAAVKPQTASLSGIGETLVAGASDPVLLLAMLLGPAAPLARTLVLEASPEDRARFRAIMGMPGVAALPDLVNLLDALRTERAFEEFMRSRS